MAGLTREQRAARDAAQQQPQTEAFKAPAQQEAPPCAPGCVLMRREGRTAEVREGKSVELMQALGWKL